jgi:hypothetical protein
MNATQTQFGRPETNVSEKPSLIEASAPQDIMMQRRQNFEEEENQRK